MRDFWSAVLALDVSLIVMVKELNSEYNYFPVEKYEKIVLRDPFLEIICADQQTLLHGITRRTFGVNGKTVYHLQIHQRDGHGLPLEVLLELLQQIEEIETVSEQGTFVHCAAGVGRTGMTFACMILMQLLLKCKTQGIRLDLDKLISGLRAQRENMISTHEQLITILGLFYKQACDLGLITNTTTSDWCALS